MSCKKFSRDALIDAQRNYPGLSLLQETAVSWAESKDIAEGVYWRDGILMRKWRPPDCPTSEDWSLVEQIVIGP